MLLLSVEIVMLSVEIVMLSVGDCLGVRWDIYARWNSVDPVYTLFFVIDRLLLPSTVYCVGTFDRCYLRPFFVVV